MKSRLPLPGWGSLICGIPCALLTIYTLFIYFFLAPHSKKYSEDIITLGMVSLWSLPLALIGLVLACFARGYRPLCCSVACIPFAGWALIVVCEGGLW
jgi:hypothetical protein